jgi:hypothetical protein
VVAIFAREVTPALTSLVKKVDEATAKHEKDEMGSFLVVLSDDKAMRDQLKDLAKKEKIKETVLTVYASKGPEDYDIAKDADVTVLLYVKKKVKANYAFHKGELQDKQIEQIVADLPRILPQK